MRSLVGYTGFVGSNIAASGSFDGLYNSKNIETAYGTNPDLLIYAGLPAEMYLANKDPQKDMEQIFQAERNIAEIRPEKLVLISTVSVFRAPVGVNESSPVDTDGLPAYGYNRYQLELWVREHYPDALIIRLPGLFGRNIKKNFIYDFINIIPFRLKAGKFEELCGKDPDLKKYYRPLDNGFWQAEIPEGDKDLLKQKFRTLGFSALNFTDSRSVYQYYDLACLWGDIQTALNAGLLLWHPAAEPVSAGELYKYLTGSDWVNELPSDPLYYDYRTLYAPLFGGTGEYIKIKERVMAEIKAFVRKMTAPASGECR